MRDFKFEFEEPYPVYRGFFVPMWDKEPVKVRRVTAEDVELFYKALEKLKELLRNVHKSGLKTVADAIALFFKAPLIQEISPTVPSPLKAHALALLLPPENLKEFKDNVEDIYEFAKVLAKLKPENLQRVQILFEPETAEIVEKLWLYFPADTRPGYNTSSLVAHSLLTSAIAWALEVEKGSNEREIEIVRISSLLHDLGKIINPEKHYEASRKIAEYLLKDILDKKEIDEICKLVEEHHLVSARKSIKRADELASAADRIAKIVDDAIGDKIAEIERITSKSRNDWKCWKEAYKMRGDFFGDLTNEFLEKAQKSLMWGDTTEEVKVILIDVGGIQDFIYRSQEIRNVIMASHIVDLVIYAHFLYYLNLQDLNVPPEAVIYSGGGNILLILPKKFAEKVKRIIEDYTKIIKPLKLHISETEFSTNYVLLRKRLEEGIFRSKYSVKLVDDVKWKKFEEYKICELCYESTAESEIKTTEGVKNVCKACKSLYEAGSYVHFAPRWEAKIRILEKDFSPKEVFESDWDDISRYIMEIIAGHNPKELESLGREVRLRDIAVIKFDGNMMGAFMSEAISFTDAIERSFRVDIAIKRAYRKALEVIYSSIQEYSEADARKTCARVFLGTIYIGGDDGLILTPSWLALPFAHFIAEEFTKQLGLTRGLSVGVAVGSARMNIWSLVDCSTSLMGLAKRFSREKMKEDPGISAICFFSFDSGSPSGEVVKRMLERFSPRLKDYEKSSVLGLSMQPYLLSPDNSEFWKVFSSLIFEPKGTNYEHAFKRAYLASSIYSEDEEAEKVKEWLSKIKNIIIESWNVVRDSEYWKEMLLVYIRRQRNRLKEEREEKDTAEAYTRLDELIKYTYAERKAIPLVDVLMVCKLLKGGVQ